MDTMIKTGTLAPDFELPDLEGNLYRLSDWRGKIVVVNFWSAECPWAEKADRELKEYQSGWGEEVSLWPVASNTNESPDLLLKAAIERGLPFVLHDANQQVADLYGALTTPHLFVLDREGILRYQGAFNDVTFRQRTPTRHYLREAVEALMDGRDPDPAQTQSYGCSIVRY
jgi:peroxiredoxin